jgi:type IV pilus assembly protein PilM
MKMKLPFSGGKRRQEQIVVIDLGGKTTKAVHMQRRSDGLHLLNYTIQDAPIFEKTPSPDLLAEHFRSVHSALGARTKHIAISIGVNDSVVRQIELPPMPVDNMRAVVKLNSKNYLQRDLSDHSFDCQELAPVTSPSGEQAKSNGKNRVLVGAARTQYLLDIQTAAKESGLIASAVLPGTVGPVNAFELFRPDAFTRDVVALVDIGFKTTSISILNAGELALNRVMPGGGDKLTAGLSNSLGMEYNEAETVKLGLPDEVKAQMQMLVTPLGRELRTSIDFFENQNDKPISEVYISGATAKSSFILETLQEELMLPCMAWNPAASIRLDLKPDQMAMLELVAPELVVAIGAACATLN